MAQAGSAGLMLLGTLAGLANVPSEDGDSFRREPLGTATASERRCPVQDTPAHESLRRKRRRSHEASGLTEINIRRTGTAEDRRQRVFKEWLASGRAAGSGKATAFAAMLNEYVSTHPDIAVQTDGDLQFDSRSLGHLLAEAAKAGDQVKKKMGAGKQGNHWAVRAPQAFGRHQTVVDERTLRGLREDRQKLRDILRLQPEGPPDAAGASKTAAPANGLHRDSLSLEYKMAVRWALVRSNCPQRTFSEVHTILVYFTMKEMGLEPDLGTVASYVPTHLAGILDFCADMDDFKMTEEAKNVNAAFGLSDKGDQKKGTSKAGITHNGVTGYNHETGVIWGPKHMSGMKVEGTGAAIAQSIVDDGKRWGISCWRGTVTDSAANCISGMVKCMQSKFPGFVAVACFLHVMNLVLVNSYLSSFGDEERGECSALRIGFMMSYLHHHFPGEWRAWASENGHGAASYLARGAAKTRWWSVMAAFSDCYKNRAAYSAWCSYMAHEHTGGYQPCFVEMAAWLKNKKSLCDMSYIIGFCATFWNAEMDWLQGIGEWQRGLPPAEQKAGFRSAEMPLRVILQRRRLQALEPPSSSNGDGYVMDPRWGEFRTNRASLSLEEQRQMDEEVANFLSTALDVHGRHSVRWLTSLVDCSLAHHNKPLAVACGAALLAIYDGVPLPVVPGSEAKQEVDGEDLDLNDVVPLIVQFADAEELRESSVLFADEDTVADIRLWVAAKGSLGGAPGLRLQTKFKDLVLGRPMHSHWAERAVNAASSLVQKCGGHEREDRLSNKVSFILNAMRVVMREALGEAEADKKALGGDREWVMDVRQIRRQKRASTGGKRIICLVVRKVEAAAALMDRGFEIAAKKSAAARRKANMDRRSFSERRIKERLENQGKSAAKRKKKHTEESADTLAAASNPKRVMLNRLDLSSTSSAPSKSVLALECDARGLGSKVKRAGPAAQNAGEPTGSLQDLMDVIIEYHGGATAVPKMTSFEGTKRSRSFVGDATSAAAKLQAAHNGGGTGPTAAAAPAVAAAAPAVATHARARATRSAGSAGLAGLLPGK